MYDSPEAQEYWSQRFGDLFANLKTVQKTAAVAQAPTTVEAIIEPTEAVEEVEEKADETTEETAEASTLKALPQYPVYPVLYYPYSSFYNQHLIVPAAVLSNQI